MAGFCGKNTPAKAQPLQQPDFSFAKADVLLAGPGKGPLGEAGMMRVVRAARPESRDIVILFSESALDPLNRRYSYNDADSLAYKMKIEKADGVHVVFCISCYGPTGTVFEPQNRIYLVNGSPEYRLKHTFTIFDALVNGIRPGSAEDTGLTTQWKNKASSLDSDFLDFSAGGVKMQARICGDAMIENDVPKIMLVSASQLPKVALEERLDRENFAIVNESEWGNTLWGKYQSGIYSPVPWGGLAVFHPVGQGWDAPLRVQEELGLRIGEI